MQSIKLFGLSFLAVATIFAGAIVPAYAEVDTDGDSIFDEVDNCRLIPNFDQADTDTDGIGDVCDGVPESTIELCDDTIDNDGNGLIDLADDACVAFRPSIVVTKHFVNDPLGKTASDFNFQWTVGAETNPFTIPVGTSTHWLTYPFLGAFTVTETPVEGFTTTYSDGCVGVLTYNANAYCDITNDSGVPVGDGEGGGDNENPGEENTIALCTDGNDNDSDDLVDAADSDCAGVFGGEGNGGNGGGNATNTPPVITVVGANPMNINLGDAFVDPGATSTDAQDGVLTPVATGTVNVAATGTYMVIYAVTDSGNLTATATRVVNVIILAPTGPAVVGASGGGGSTPPACADGSDNDGDGKSDYPNDPGCESSIDSDEANAAVVATTTDSGSGSSSGSGTSTQAVGEVLGAATATEPGLPAGCTPFINDYLKMSRKNSSDEVMKLQQFLNEFAGTNLPVTGFFGPMTHKAVKEFQKKHRKDILDPWIAAGWKTKDLENGTGYVFKTTKRWINVMKCNNTLDIPMPELIPDGMKGA